MHPAKPDAGVYRAPRGYADYEGDRQFATTLARGMELLRSFSPASPVLGNKELAEALDLPRATVSRLAYTLQAMGYLAQDQDSGKYRLGAAVLSLGYPLLEAFKLRQRARAGMWELAQQLRGAVAIAIRERLDMIYIEVARGGERGGHTSDIGRTYPIAGTAVGRAHVAACGAQERQYLLNRIQVKTPADWKRHKERLLEAEAEYSRWGCCTSVGDMYPDVQAVAVPLGPMDRGYPAVINVSFQRRKLDQRWLREDVGPKLVALARSLA